jgi:hypothetical protein
MQALDPMTEEKYVTKKTHPVSSSHGPEKRES